MREQFEKLPDVARNLHPNIVFIDGSYKAITADLFDSVNFLNGAWYAYQEQQKKIDAVLKIIDEKCNKFCESRDMDSVALLEEIEELLK